MQKFSVSYLVLFKHYTYLNTKVVNKWLNLRIWRKNIKKMNQIVMPIDYHVLKAVLEH